jgi:hypothetical protein
LALTLRLAADLLVAPGAGAAPAIMLDAELQVASEMGVGLQLRQPVTGLHLQHRLVHARSGDRWHGRSARLHEPRWHHPHRQLVLGRRLQLRTDLSLTRRSCSIDRRRAAPGVGDGATRESPIMS